MLTRDERLILTVSSLREVSGGMLGLSGKEETVRINSLPKKSTLSDANKGRKVDFFEEIYTNLLEKYGFILSDSRIKEALSKNVKIVDSTTISLFKDILKCVGRKSVDGKSKGGIKSHSVINADEKVPSLVWFTSAATHDHQFLKKLKCDEHTVYIFDKGYNDYVAFEHFTNQKTGFVTRIKENAKFEVTQTNDIPENIHSGILSDEIIEVEVNKEGAKTTLKLRKIKYYDREHKRSFELRAKQSSNITRILYFFVVGHQIILTNGFVKKTQKTPPEEIALAQKYRADYFYRKESSS
jgi:phage-related protein